ncbi:MAG: tetratricopeptide repeat protein, partial [Planctomycetota bacterium]
MLQRKRFCADRFVAATRSWTMRFAAPSHRREAHTKMEDRPQGRIIRQTMEGSQVRTPILTFGAIALAVTFVSGGCTTGAIGADREGIVQQPLEMPNPAQKEYRATYDRYHHEFARRPLVAPALGYEAPSKVERIADTLRAKTEAGLADLKFGLKSKFESVGRLLAFEEPADSTDDPTSLSSDAKPSPRLYTATAKLAEQAGNPAKAEEYYRKALRLDRNYFDALFGLAHLLDRQGRLAEATEYYRRACDVAPNNPTTFNDLAICYARRQMPAESMGALQRAVDLAPKSTLYRHNLATVLVQMGETDQALRHLKAVHDEATAYYNLGFLLQKKGDRASAAYYFAQAVKANPNFEEAKLWLQALGGVPAAREPASPTGPQRSPERVARRPEPQPSLNPFRSLWPFRKEADASSGKAAPSPASTQTPGGNHVSEGTAASPQAKPSVSTSVPNSGPAPPR